LVDVAWVKANAGKAGVVVLDVGAKVSYLRGHNPGAIYTSYGGDGWRGKDAHGTLAQFPGVGKLETLIGRLGIDNAAHVVLVPTGWSAADMGVATRIYWTFKVLGHDAVSILDGGMAAYTDEVDKKGKPVNPVQRGKVKPGAKTFKASLRKDMLVTKDDVKKALEEGVELVDNRPSNQYLGVNRIGVVKRNGTIPGAKNVPENWMTVNGGGKFREPAALAKLYAAAGVSTDAPQINFCNTGHWATLGWFVSRELMGNTQAKMYDGSMLEWAADENMPVEVKVDAR
jgi:thiosulfate/3-mercaptopyruvate sulfurtransferase